MIADLAMQHALDRYHDLGVLGLTEEEKTLATIWYFEARVANGGLEHFYRAQEGELAPYAPEAFRRVGAEALATIAEKANAVFGPGGIPDSRQTRGEFLDRLPVEVRWIFDTLESEYAAFDQDLDGLVETYAIHTHEAGSHG